VNGTDTNEADSQDPVEVNNDGTNNHEDDGQDPNNDIDPGGDKYCRHRNQQ